MAASYRARDNAGEVLVTAALLGLSLAANLWTSVYFKRYPIGSWKEEQEAALAKQQNKDTTAAVVDSDKPSPDASRDDEKSAPGSGKRSEVGGGENAEIAMTLLAVGSTLSTALLTLLLWAAHRRAFPRSVDGFLLSSLLSLLIFVFVSMLRRWHSFFDWVFYAYAAAALGYAIEARFRFCNQLIDSLGGVEV